MNLLEHYRSYDGTFLINDHPDLDLHLVKYLHAGIDWSIKGALDARGIILDGEGNVIARPYPKFFNYNQLNDYLEDGTAVRRDLPEEILTLDQWDDGTFIATEKLDGSLIITFLYNDEIMFASSGSFTSEHARMGKKLFYDLYDDLQIVEMRKLMKENTLCFEMLSPNYQIVIHYDEEKLVLHGVINTQTGARDILEMIKFADDLGIERMKLYNYTREELLKIKKENTELEGFVIVFLETGKLLKVKTDDYFEKSYNNEFYISDMFTKAKLTTIVENIKDDNWDDIMLGAEGRKNAKKQLGQVYNFVDKILKKLEDYSTDWQLDLCPDPKEIATNPKYKDIKHIMFLARKDESYWYRHILSEVVNKFVRSR